MSNKTYLNGIIVKAKQTQYGELLTASIKVDDLINELKANAKNGWVNITVKQRREVSPKGVTHSVEVDTWEPTQSAATAPQNSPQQDNRFASSDADNDLPF